MSIESTRHRAVKKSKKKNFCYMCPKEKTYKANGKKRKDIIYSCIGSSLWPNEEFKNGRLVSPLFPYVYSDKLSLKLRLSKEAVAVSSSSINYLKAEQRNGLKIRIFFHLSRDLVSPIELFDGEDFLAYNESGEYEYLLIYNIFDFISEKIDVFFYENRLD